MKMGSVRRSRFSAGLFSGCGPTMAVTLAFCCLAFAAANDFVFKLFARKERSRGAFVFAVGVLFTAVLMLFLRDNWWGQSWKATLFWGVVCGLCSVVGNILLIESMARLSAGLCSTVYRLNLALVVPLAVIVFGETRLWYQWIGVALALLAVLAFMPVGEKKPASARNIDYVMLILAMVLRAGMGIAYKYAFKCAGAAESGVQIVNGLAWVVGGIAYYLLGERKTFACREAFSSKVLGYGAFSGVLVTGIIYFMAKSLAVGDASIVLPIQQMSFLATFFLGVFFLKEKITMRKVAALLCGVAALLLLSVKPKPKPAEPASAVESAAKIEAEQP